MRAVGAANIRRNSSLVVLPGPGFFRDLSAVFSRAFDGFQDQAGHAILFILVWGSLFLAFGFSLLFVIIFVISSLVKSGFIFRIGSRESSPMRNVCGNDSGRGIC